MPSPRQVRDHPADGVVKHQPESGCFRGQFVQHCREGQLGGKGGDLRRLPRRRPCMADKLAVAEALERVELSEYAHRQMGQLSGGQKKRTFVARGMAQEATTLLLREPFAGVDKRSEATIRDGHPATPLLVVSPIQCAIHEKSPGPGALDLAALSSGAIRFCATGDPAEIPAGKLTLQVIRQELGRIVRQRAQDDANIHYLDGLALYGAHDEDEHPLPDALHPQGNNASVMGERFAALAFAPGAPFGA